MNTPTRFVEPLTEAQIARLEQLWKGAETHRPRTRALAILLSNKGYSLEQIAEVCFVTRDTVGRWLDSWDEDEEDGLEDADRCGAPRRFEPHEEERILQLLDLYPNQPKRIQALIQEETGKELTDDILGRLAHEHEYR